MINKIQSLNNRTNYKQNFGMAVKTNSNKVYDFFDTTNPDIWNVDKVNNFQIFIENLIEKHKDNQYVDIILGVKEPDGITKCELLTVALFNKIEKSWLNPVYMRKDANPDGITKELSQISKKATKFEQSQIQRKTKVKELKKAGGLFDAIEKL